MDVIDFVPRTQLVHYFIHELEQFENQTFHRNFCLLPKVDHFSFEPITHSAPLIFLEQQPPVQPEAKVLIDEFVQFRHDRLKKGGNSNRVVNSSWNIANAKLQRREERMRAHVPPNLLPIVYAAGLYQQV